MRLRRAEVGVLLAAVQQACPESLPDQCLGIHPLAGEVLLELVEELTAKADPDLNRLLVTSMGAVCRGDLDPAVQALAARELILLFEQTLRALLGLLAPDALARLGERRPLGDLLGLAKKQGLLPGDPRSDLHELMLRPARTEMRFPPSVYGELLRETWILRNAAAHGASGATWLQAWRAPVATLFATLQEHATALRELLGPRPSEVKRDVDLGVEIRVAAPAPDMPARGQAAPVLRDPRGGAHLRLQPGTDHIVDVSGTDEPAVKLRAVLSRAGALAGATVWVFGWPASAAEGLGGAVMGGVARAFDVHLWVLVDPPPPPKAVFGGVPMLPGSGVSTPLDLCIDASTLAVLDRRPVGRGGAPVVVVQRVDAVHVCQQLQLAERTVEAALSSLMLDSSRWPRRTWLLAGESSDAAARWWSVFGTHRAAVRGQVVTPPKGVSVAPWVVDGLPQGALAGHGLVVCVREGADEIAEALRDAGVPAVSLLAPLLSAPRPDAGRAGPRAHAADPFASFMAPATASRALAELAAWAQWSSAGQPPTTGTMGQILDRARQRSRQVGEAFGSSFNTMHAQLETAAAPSGLLHVLAEAEAEGDLSPEEQSAFVHWMVGVKPELKAPLVQALLDRAREVRRPDRARLLDLLVALADPTQDELLAVGSLPNLLFDAALAGLRAGADPAVPDRMPRSQRTVLERHRSAGHPDASTYATENDARVLAALPSTTSRDAVIAWLAEHGELAPAPLWWSLFATPPTVDAVKHLLGAAASLRLVPGLLGAGETVTPSPRIARAVHQARRMPTEDPSC